MTRMRPDHRMRLTLIPAVEMKLGLFLYIMSSEDDDVVCDGIARVNYDWLHASDDEDAQNDYEIKGAEEGFRDYNGETDPNVAPRYYDWRKIFPEIQTLLDNHQVLIDEMKLLTEGSAWTPWPEERLYDGPGQSGDWKVV